MSRATDNLTTLADHMATHLGVGHHAISMRIKGKGDFFLRLKNACDCNTSTAEDAFDWFDQNWPVDLEWPEGIPRPSHMKQKSKDAA